MSDMSSYDDAPPSPSRPIREWFCLRTQTKREHIAAAHLSQIEHVDVFCPRISQIKKTRNGKKRFVDALFPGYIFACFNYLESYRKVIHTQGVSGIIEHGMRKTVPTAIIDKLRASFPDAITIAPDPSIEPGANIELVSGSLQGLRGTVLATLPASNRIQILLDFLGREITVSVSSEEILLSEKNS